MSEAFVISVRMLKMVEDQLREKMVSESIVISVSMLKMMEELLKEEG